MGDDVSKAHINAIVSYPYDPDNPNVKRCVVSFVILKVKDGVLGIYFQISKLKVQKTLDRSGRALTMC